MEAEEYNEFGDIVKRPPKPVVYERGMTTHQLHRIHVTKDLFDGGCFLCEEAAKKLQSHWSEG